MKNPFVACLAFALTLALPAAADFAPLRVGNTWTYKGSVHIRAWSNPPETRFQEHLELRVTRFASAPDGGVWSIQVRDSLSDRTQGGIGSMLPLKDTVLAFTLMLKENPDGTLSRVSPRPLNLPAPAFHSLFANQVAENIFFRSHMAPPTFRELEGENGGYVALETDTRFPDPMGKSWLVNDVGLYWMDLSTGPMCDVLFRTLLLERFNGRVVNLGLPVPKPPLAKESRIACAILRRPSGALSALRIPSGASLDFLGRTLSDTRP